MKKVFILIFILFKSFAPFCQVVDSNIIQNRPLDSSQRTIKKIVHKKKPLKINVKAADSSRIDTVFSSQLNIKPNIDTLKTDSIQKIVANPIRISPNHFIDYNIVFNNKMLNTTGPVLQINAERKTKSKEVNFYIIAILLLIFGLFKVFYSKYFQNVFKVFFNTSLRQNQLTDILIQARLASLIFNLLFIISAGIYLWLLLTLKNYFINNSLILLPLCMLGVSAIYLTKFLIIKLMGWVTTFNAAANQYIFVIFLINKMIAVFLIPFIVLLAFGPLDWVPSLILLSLLLLGTLFLLRYFRTYGLLQKQLSLNLLHFIIYFAATEILPLLALYKLFVNYGNTLPGFWE